MKAPPSLLVRLVLASAVVIAGCAGSIDQTNLYLNWAAVIGTFVILAVVWFGVQRQRTKQDDIDIDRKAALEAQRADDAEGELDSIWSFGLALVKVGNAPQLRDAHYVRVSEAFCKLLGYTREDILAVPYIELVHPDSYKETCKMADQIDAGGAKVLKEFVNAYLAGPLHRKPGSKVWLQWMVAGLSDDETVYHVTDVTGVQERSHLFESERDEAVSDLEAMRPAVDLILRTPTSRKVLPDSALEGLTRVATNANPSEITDVN